MALVSKSGLTALGMRASGVIIRLVVEVNSGTSMEMSSRVNGLRTKLMDMECMSI